MSEVPQRVRDAAIAAFDQQTVDGVVLDLVADMLSDQFTGTSEPTRRRLRFAGHGRVAEVAVRETRSLTLDVRLSPDEPAFIEVRTADDHGRVETQRCDGRQFTLVRPGPTTMLICWTDDEKGMARTASVRL